MARQSSIIKLKGTIGGVTFYKSKMVIWQGKKAVWMPRELRMILHFKEREKTARNSDARGTQEKF